ncbi:uncharacterized protein APUU_41414A [Aspergillus puulaauensis]|uniref:Uncharacterized protein n=1 Tax=Aspergillus puulaauensis TaxID=1220207 RepID=A0A7R8APV0_9EURO|nr:uncharacterized protein APUU_41414A [Aspergillus puulaauensis]BCS24970.1 hypothetical protein APUU_41414A [Aspergillus puulaauensis]
MQTKDDKGNIIHQKEILEIEPRPGGKMGKKNIHYDAATGKWEGPLDYNEFIQRLDGKETGPDVTNMPKLKAPEGVDDLERAVKELIDDRRTAQLKIGLINERIGQSGGRGNMVAGAAGAQLRDDGKYQTLMSALNDQLVKWRRSNDYDKIKARDTAMKALTDRVVQLRIEDGYRFMVDYFTLDKHLGLGDKIVLDKDQKSLVPGGPDYDRLNLGETWKQHKKEVSAAIKKSTNGEVVIKRSKDFVEWVTDFGDPNGRFARETKASPSHFITLQMWRSINEMHPC